MTLYVNGQDISRFVLALERAGTIVWGGGEVRPEEFLKTLDAFLVDQKITINDIDRVYLVAGPGSATALRASLSIVNTLSFVANIEIIKVEKKPEEMDEKVFERVLLDADLVVSDTYIRPIYAHEPRITKTNKDRLRREKK